MESKQIQLTDLTPWRGKLAGGFKLDYDPELGGLVYPDGRPVGDRRADIEFAGILF